MYHQMSMSIKKKNENMKNVEYYTNELKSIIATKNYQLLLHFIFYNENCSQLIQNNKPMLSNLLQSCKRNNFDKGYQLIEMFATE